MKRALIAGLAIVGLALVPATQASALTSSTATFTGQGVMADGFGGYDLIDELCGVENGADVDGPYLLWVFTSTKASTATITGPWGTADMTKFGKGTFKYVSAWYDPDILVNNVSATSDKASTNPQLVISHGCRPFTDRGAWCSPGFWRNSDDAAWALTDYTRDDSFNTTAYPYWYGATFASNPTLTTVLTANGGTYKGAPIPGSSGYELNAYNATGAMLTDSLDGFAFDWDVMMVGSDDGCPIDNHGNLKE